MKITAPDGTQVPDTDNAGLLAYYRRKGYKVGDGAGQGDGEKPAKQGKRGKGQAKAEPKTPAPADNGEGAGDGSTPPAGDPTGQPDPQA